MPTGCRVRQCHQSLVCLHTSSSPRMLFVGQRARSPGCLEYPPPSDPLFFQGKPSFLFLFFNMNGSTPNPLKPVLIFLTRRFDGKITSMIIFLTRHFVGNSPPISYWLPPFSYNKSFRESGHVYFQKFSRFFITSNIWTYVRSIKCRRKKTNYTTW
jgi:hypothetical protein